MARGRPTGQMTHRRRQVLAAYAEVAAQGQRISWAELARRCGLHSYSDARRIIRDLEKIGAIAN
jgi:ribosomal protein S25